MHIPDFMKWKEWHYVVGFAEPQEEAKGYFVLQVHRRGMGLC